VPASSIHRASRAAALLATLLGSLLAVGAPAPAASAAALDFREQSLHLPGAPAALVPADLDGDGLQDLAVVVVYTEWDQIGVEELTEMDQVEGLVEVLTIVPVLLDRREVRAFLGRPGGGLEPAGEPLPLPLSVLTLEPGPPGIPALALTDDGASALRFDREAGALVLEPLLSDPPVLAGTGSFLAGLDLVRDATGDGVEDLLLPAPDGIALYRGTGRGLAAEADSRTPLPDDPADGGGLTLDYPLPRVEDLDGDGLPDLLFRVSGRRTGQGSGGGFRVLRRLPSQGGPARFGPPAAVELPAAAGPGDGEDAETEDLTDGSSGRRPAWVGRLAPAGPGAAARLESLDDEDAGMRKSMAQAREPSYRVHLHPLAPDLSAAPEPAGSFRVTGYVLGDEGSDLTLPGGFQDLNGDGRTDLVTVTNDISLFKALAVLATRRLSLELGFHPYCQNPDGSLVRAPGAPLTSRLTLDLADLALRQRSLFAGDFDGDGRADFLQLGRPREIGVHRGRADCSYPERADATIRLRDELRDLALVEARDLDGDGRTDLAVTHLQRVDDPGVTPPVRLDLYLTRSAGGGGR
jgi:hypothetical protein